LRTEALEFDFGQRAGAAAAIGSCFLSKAFIMRFLPTWLVLLLLAVAGPAVANEDAESFAKRTIDRGFAILRDENGTSADRQARFHAFILQYVDARKSGMFALGVYRRGADAAVLDAYAAAFTEYTIEIYESRLENYKNATLTVIGSLENKPGDTTVNTLGSSPSLREPVRIAFRLAAGNGSYKITDIQVEGIWLSVELRDEFASLLAGNGGDISALTRILTERTSKMRAAVRQSS
jgi:phospholipid transport system substrate-binding protein